MCEVIIFFGGAFVLLILLWAFHIDNENDEYRARYGNLNSNEGAKDE